jgi:hypothetical protein
VLQTGLLQRMGSGRTHYVRKAAFENDQGIKDNYQRRHPPHLVMEKHAERGINMSDIIANAPPIEHPEQTGPLDPHEINPKIASDIAYWSKALGVTGEQLHGAIRLHGTHVGKVCAALHTHKPR